MNKPSPSVLAALTSAPAGDELPSHTERVAWRRIYGVLRQAIIDGIYAAGDRLPVESDLAEHFQVNRHTVRRALGELTRDGLIEQAQGRGTFVTFGRRLDVLLGAEPVLSSHYGLRLQQVERNSIEAGKHLASLLDLEPHRAVVELELLVVWKDHPLGLATLWFAHTHYARIADILRRERTLEAALTSCGITGRLIAGAPSVSGRIASARELGLLKTRQERSLLVIEQCVFAGRTAGHGLNAVYAATIALRGDAVRLMPG